MLQSVMLKYIFSSDEVIWNNGVPYLEVRKLGGDKVDHQVLLTGLHCTCDHMPNEHSDYVPDDCPHRRILKNRKEEYAGLIADLVLQARLAPPKSSDDDWLDYIQQQNDNVTLWMM